MTAPAPRLSADEIRVMGMACRTISAVARTTDDAAASEKIASLLILAGGMDRATAAGIAFVLSAPLRAGIKSICAED